MHNLRFYGLMIGFSITIMMSCDTLAFKVIHIYSFDFAASGLIYSLNFMLSSIITEVYGYNLAGRVIWVQLICHFLFIGLINFIVLLPSPERSSTHLLYFNLFNNMWHILLGCIAMPTAYFINDIIVSKLKINLYGQKFIRRFLISSIIGSAVLVLISYPINFYGHYPLKQIMRIAANTWMYKVCASIILLPIAMFLIEKLKHFEKTDYYDYGTSYNPLNVFSTQQSGENRYESKPRNKNNSDFGYSSI